MELVNLIPVVLFSVLGIWRRNPVPFGVAGVVAVFTGFKWGDVDSSTFGLAVGIAIVFYGIYCFAEMFRYIFWRFSS